MDKSKVINIDGELHAHLVDLKETGRFRTLSDALRSRIGWPTLQPRATSKPLRGPGHPARYRWWDLFNEAIAGEPKVIWAPRDRKIEERFKSTAYELVFDNWRRWVEREKGGFDYIEHDVLMGAPMSPRSHSHCFFKPTRLSFMISPEDRERIQPGKPFIPSRWAWLTGMDPVTRKGTYSKTYVPGLHPPVPTHR